MINALYEFRKGIFFIRVCEEAKEEDIYKIINKTGMKKLVINVTETNKYNDILTTFLKRSSVKLKIYLVCNDKNKEFFKEKFKKVKIINNELEVFDLVET